MSRNPSILARVIVSSFVIGGTIVEASQLETTPSGVLGVCEATRIHEGSREPIWIRGTGVVPEVGLGIILIDRVCATGEAKKPSQFVHVLVSEEASPVNLRNRVRREERVGRGRVFQLLMRGKLECRIVKRNGDSVFGDGFGPYGRYSCMLQVDKIKVFEEIK